MKVGRKTTKAEAIDFLIRDAGAVPPPKRKASEIQGEPFEVVRDLDTGETMLEDGITVPADSIDALPVDREGQAEAKPKKPRIGPKLKLAAESQDADSPEDMMYKAALAAMGVTEADAKIQKPEAKTPRQQPQGQPPKRPGLSDKARQARDEAAKAIDDLGDLLDGRVSSNAFFDPELIKAVGAAIGKSVKAGSLSFAEVTHRIFTALRKKYGDARARRMMEAIAPVYESTWTRLRSISTEMSPTGKVASVLDATDVEPEATGTSKSDSSSGQMDPDEIMFHAQSIVLSDVAPTQKGIGMRRLAKAAGISIKEAQEYTESALIETARLMVLDAGSDPAWQRDAFDRLVEMYENQPRFSKRTSTSVANQAYSTPIPLAYATNLMAGINRDSVVYENVRPHARRH